MGGGKGKGPRPGGRRRTVIVRISEKGDAGCRSRSEVTNVFSYARMSIKPCDTTSRTSQIALTATQSLQKLFSSLPPVRVVKSGSESGSKIWIQPDGRNFLNVRIRL
jgi:hypothetical protein